MFFDLKRHSLVEVMTCLNTCTIRTHRFFFLFFNFMFDLEKIKKLRWWEFQANHVSTGQEENHNYYNPMPHLEIIMIMTLIIIWFVTDVSRWPLQLSPLWTCVWFLTGRWAPIRQAGKVMRSDGTSSQCERCWRAECPVTSQECGGPEGDSSVFCWSEKHTSGLLCARRMCWAYPSWPALQEGLEKKWRKNFINLIPNIISPIAGSVY